MSEESRKMAKLAVEALEDKKAEDIKVIDVSKVSVIADYFIIAGGNNSSQIQALCDNVKRNWEEPVSLPDRPKDMKPPTGYC